MDNIDYLLLSLSINLSAAGLRGWGKLMYVASGAVEMTDMGYKWERFYDSWKEDHQARLIDLGLAVEFRECRCSFAPALGASAADLCLNYLLCYDPTPAPRSGLCQRNTTPRVSGLAVFLPVWAFHPVARETTAAFSLLLWSKVGNMYVMKSHGRTE